MPKWLTLFLKLVREQRGTFRIEQLREQVEAAGYRPRTNNKYGGQTAALVKAGELIRVDRVYSHKKKTRHPVGVYRRAKVA